MGLLPSAVTSAEPMWVPFAVRAGQPAQPDPRERHLDELRQLTTDDHSLPIAWAPDSRRLLFVRSRQSSRCGALLALDLATANVEPLSPPGSRTAGATFAGTDRLIMALLPGAVGQCAAPSRRAASPWPESDLFALKLSHTKGGEAPLTAGTLEPLVAGPGYQAEPTASLMAKLLVFTSGRDGETDLYRARLSGNTPVPLTHSPGRDWGAKLSPDGSKLVWQAERSAEPISAAGTGGGGAGTATATTRKVVVMLAGARGQHPRRLVAAGRNNLTPSFAPDSQRVFYASDVEDTGEPHRPDTNFELYVIDPDGPAMATGEPRAERITYDPGSDTDPLVSPDGQWLAFASSRASRLPGGRNVFIARLLSR